MFAEIDGLRWVVDRERMAFSETTCRRAKAIARGDSLFLYVGRGAFHNPTRDRSQLAGVARIESEVRRLRQPIEIHGREYTCACDITIQKLLPERQGVEFAPLVKRLSFVKKPEAWGYYLRSGFLELSESDAKALLRALNRASSSDSRRAL